MDWKETAIILGTWPHGERGVIVEVLAQNRGRWRGRVPGGASRKARPLLQPGNIVQADWRARLEDQLGMMRIELIEGIAGRHLADPFALDGLALLVADLHLLPEREPEPAIFRAARTVLDHLGEPTIWPALLARLELALLATLGFGLDLSRCAAGGSGPLVWVSPKSGRAVSEEAGRPYADKLLPLPAFLRPDGQGEGQGNRPVPTARDQADALRLTGFFLRRHVLTPRGLKEPHARDRIIRRLKERDT